MISFKGGPAGGKALVLRRAPVYLRVVISGRGKVDALDQLDDQAEPGEAVHVYRRVGKPLRVHLLMAVRSQSGWRLFAEYELYAEQPPDEVLHDNARWAEWATEQHKKGATGS